jgi:DNA/RNA-binding domain of Phe-tRNA-synthetase-like protein
VTEDDLQATDGAVEAGLAAELPGLRLRVAVTDGSIGRTPRELRARLEDVTSRFRGAQAVLLRSRPVPHAYRVLFRHLGLDPDRDRTPVEQAAVQRLITGAFCTGDRLIDALALAVIETGVPVCAFDDERLDGDVGLRAARAGETIADGAYAHDVPAGRLVLADAAGPVAVLFGRLSDRHAPSRQTRRLRLVAVVAPGVPGVHVDEALWLAHSALADPPPASYPPQRRN